MKFIALAAAALTLTACMETETIPLIPLDDPRRAEQDARHVGSLYGASGIAGIAFVGSSHDTDWANILFDSRYSTSAEVAAAPEKVCAFLNGTVESVRNEANQSGMMPEYIRVLNITCNV